MPEHRQVRGVVFDFYDTLVYVDETKPRLARREMLAALGVPETVFAPAWRSGRDRRMSGQCGDLAQQMGETLVAIGVEAPPARLRQFAARDIAALLEAVGVYPNTRRVLKELRQRGYRLALLSNCSYTGEIVLDHLSFWSLFDAVVLSHLLGVLKPDPAIYQEACRRLGLEPAECAFVGDGAFGELDAAHRLGMLAVRVTQERQSLDYGSSNHADRDIGDVAELLDILPDLARPRETP
jgi:putative hydrolase of the HAD superfamily